MITVKGSAETSLIIKKSKFLGLASRVENEQQANAVLEQRRKQYFDATHNCFAYVLENGSMRYSDDGEPQGTAGLPMLDVIRKTGVSDVLVICTRYFGGTLLGAGPLARAYTKSASDTLDAAQKARLVPCSIFACAFPYNVWAKVEKSLEAEGFIIKDIKYSDLVTATICVEGGNEELFTRHIKSISSGKTAPIFLGRELIELPL